MIDKRQTLILMLIFPLVASFGSVFINAWLYQARYREVSFVSLKPPTCNLTPDSIEVAEPITNTTWNADGSKNVSIFISEVIIISDGGQTIRENQLAAQTMKLSAEVFSRSYGNLDAFEDVTKGKEKLKKQLEWISFKTGITKSLAHVLSLHSAF